ncbi:MAG TPA: hypothetical protein VL588_12685 [Bdellovibrionota bacterium]|jgi:hypothetical protein|nr:hypothetical protein [Bdellovibrionota bacterium]
MKSKILISVAFIALGLLPSAARADWLIEPGVGYENLRFKDNSLSPPFTSHLDGLTFDIRVGMTAGPGIFGVAGHAALLTDPQGTPPTNSYAATSLGVFAELNLPEIPVIPRAQFNFLADLKNQEVRTGVSGTEFRFGLQYRFLHWLAINVDYVFDNYVNAYDDLAHTHSAIPSGQTPDSSSFILTLSAPLKI